MSGITKEEFSEMITDIVRKVMKEKETTPEYYTRKDLCRMFKVTLPTVHNWVNEGQLHPEKAGRRTLFRSDEVEKVLLKKKSNAERKAA